MSLSTLRDHTAIITLMDQYSFSTWYKQLQSRCLSLGIWNTIDPNQTETPVLKPKAPLLPQISDYAPRGAAPSLSTNGRALRNRTIPDQSSDSTLTATPAPETVQQARFKEDLSEAGAKAYENDLEMYKLTLENYKIHEREYRDERANLDKATAIIQSSVTTHLLNTCCIPGLSLREWVINLKLRMGTTTAEEKEIARKRYREALKPMRTANQWNIWLLEYDEASTEAELKGVGELSDPEGVFKDFLDSVRKVAQNWADNFKQNHLNQPGMTRKEMMKRFRETMSDDYPKKTTHHRGAFAVGGEEHSHDRSSFAAGGESTPGSNERDASHAAKSAPSAPSNDSTRGSRKNKQRQSTGQRASSKRPRSESVHTDGAKCPACNGPHPLSRCFYINKDQAPEWFKPRREMEVMVSKLLDLDLDLQAQVRALKRTRTQTPAIKVSQTPEASTE